MYVLLQFFSTCLSVWIAIMCIFHLIRSKVYIQSIRGNKKISLTCKKEKVQSGWKVYLKLPLRKTWKRSNIYLSTSSYTETSKLLINVKKLNRYLSRWPQGNHMHLWSYTHFLVGVFVLFFCKKAQEIFSCFFLSCHISSKTMVDGLVVGIYMCVHVLVQKLYISVKACTDVYNNVPFLTVHGA